MGGTKKANAPHTENTAVLDGCKGLFLLCFGRGHCSDKKKTARRRSSRAFQLDLQLDVKFWAIGTLNRFLANSFQRKNDDRWRRSNACYGCVSARWMLRVAHIKFGLPARGARALAPFCVGGRPRATVLHPPSFFCPSTLFPLNSAEHEHAAGDGAPRAAGQHWRRKGA